MNNFFKGVLTFFGVILFFWNLFFSQSLFPPELVLNLFSHKVSQADLDKLEYDYGQMAGYPAGEGIPVAETIEDYERLGGYTEQTVSDETSRYEYFTFETDSIIPLDFYQLMSNADVRISRRRRGRAKDYRDTYITSGLSIDRNYYNRYYLVKLPDGNYVPAWLEDSYYWKYKLTGRVQLPLGCKSYTDPRVQETLSSYAQEYGLDGEVQKVLLMFSSERYEQRKTLYFVIRLVVLVIAMAIPVAVVWLVQKAYYKWTRSKELD